MEGFKGTPGPWLRDGRTVYALQDSTSRFVDKENRFSAGFYSGNGCSESEVIANATLAEAAPELLEALQEMVAIVKKHTYPQPDKPSSTWGRMEAAEAVISKALGQ